MIIEWKLEGGAVAPMMHYSLNRVYDMFYPVGEKFTIEKIGDDLYKVTDPDGRYGKWMLCHLTSFFSNEDLFLATLEGFES